MLCSNCSKLSFSNKNKKCMKCQGDIVISISVICDFCSLTEKKCSGCLKSINTNPSIRSKGCNCGK